MIENCIKINSILQSEFDVLSVDIFDTLLLRMCDEPQEIFELMVRDNLMCGAFTFSPAEFRAVRVEAESQARKALGNSAIQEVTIFDIYEQMSFLDGHQSELIELELETEKQYSYLNQEIVSLIEQAKSRGKQVYLLSDMYWPHEKLKELLTTIGFDFTDIELIVSCDYGCSKFSGNLYDVLMKKTGVSPQQIIHVGDNLYADVQQAQFKGIMAHHYNLIPDEPTSCYSYEKLVNNDSLTRLKSLRKVAASGSCEVAMPYRFWFEFGAEVLGPFFTGFIDSVMENCERQNISLFLPLMREGEFFTKLLQSAISYYGCDVDVVPLFVSRQATYFAQVKEFNLSLLNDFFLRTNFSVRNLLTVFNIIDDGESFFGNNLDIHLSKSHLVFVDSRGQYLDEVIKQFFSEPELFAKVNQFVKEQHELFSNYIKQEVKGKKALTIDLGFIGTIAQAIDAVNNNSLQVEHYLAVSSPHMVQKLFEGVLINAFLKTTSNHRTTGSIILRSPEVVEQLIMSLKYGTTTGYKRDESGCIAPITKPCSFNEHEKLIRHYTQQGILEFQNCWFKLKTEKKLPFLHNYLDVEELGRIISRFIECPTPVEVKNLSALCHDDNFGSDSVEPLLKHEILVELEKGGVDKFLSYSTAIRPYGTVYWPQLYVAYSKPYYFVEKYSSLNPQNFELRKMLEMKRILIGSNIQSVVIYGASITGEKLCTFIKNMGIDIVAFCDRNEKLWGTSLCGVKIKSFLDVQEEEFDAYIIGSLGRGYEIQTYIENAGTIDPPPAIIVPFS